MLRRRRFKQTQSLQERLIQEAKRLYDEARLLPPGPVRDAALKRARQAEAAAHLDEWLNSPGLRPGRRSKEGRRLVASNGNRGSGRQRPGDAGEVHVRD
jgi:hypothetical protein